MENLAQILLLLVVGVAVVLLFHRLHIPTSLGYLLVGLILGPYTAGPTVYVPEFEALGQFGVVFLMFTIGLNFSLPQLHAMRHQILGLGSLQVLLSTLLVMLVTWAAGLPLVAAFVIGAVFAQSSTTIMASQLAEQGEDASQHGRLGLAMSVFQDVTAVPFLVIIPVLASAISMQLLGQQLGIALAKALLAFALVFFVGRWLLRPLFALVIQTRTPELFTLCVLLVSLLAAWATNGMGLSLAFGAFLAGMMLGETEFRHQVESTIRPFRDVLLGLFFVGIGMLVNPAELAGLWHWSLLGAALIMLTKAPIVTGLVRLHGIDMETALRTGLLMSVGGEFGFALLALALSAGVIDGQLGQAALLSVLLAMIAGAFVIRFNHVMARWLCRQPTSAGAQSPLPADQGAVLIGGYGHVGHTVAVLLHARGIPFLALDTDPQRVALGRATGHNVIYGNIADPALLATLQVERAALVLLTQIDPAITLNAVSLLRRLCPQVPVLARAEDLSSSALLQEAGALHAYPEAIEASLRLGAAALALLKVPAEDVEVILDGIRSWNYSDVAEPDVGQPGRESTK